MENKNTDIRKVIFNKLYKFEGKEYTELDLSKLDDLTTSDLMEIDKHFNTTEYISPIPEMDTKYDCLVAARACSLPIEFFNNLPAKEGKKVANAVKSFFQE